MMSKCTVKQIAMRKQEKIPLTMLTAYDAAFASLIDNAGIDVVLVGDSLRSEEHTSELQSH